MPRKNPFRPTVPDPEFMALWPEGWSGNAVNGLGEPLARQPKLVWWAPDTKDPELAPIEFGPMQDWFYAQEPPDPDLMALRAQRRSLSSRLSSSRSPRSTSGMNPANWSHNSG